MRVWERMGVEKSQPLVADKISPPLESLLAKPIDRVGGKKISGFLFPIYTTASYPIYCMLGLLNKEQNAMAEYTGIYSAGIEISKLQALTKTNLSLG